MSGLTQQQICECFNRLFGMAYNVRLHGGGREPDYLPPTNNRLGRIVAREDFAASALHEAAHWCVASQRRRQLPDYGYSYLPPPRGPSGQALFFESETRVQATESYLAHRAGVVFRASADDPDFCLATLRRFEAELQRLVACWEDARLPECAPPRAVKFGQALVLLHTRLATDGVRHAGR